jgi:general stress protein YciG
VSKSDAPDSNEGTVDLELATVGRLHIAAAIATQVRRGSHRKVNTWDPKTGETIKRDVLLDEALVGIAKVNELTFSVRDDAPQTVCAGWEGKCPTGAKPGPTAFRASKVARRKGEPWRCKHCGNQRMNMSRTPDRRREIGRKANACLTREQRTANLAKTPEQRSRAGRKGAAAMLANTTPAQRSEIARRASAVALVNTTPEHRSELARLRNREFTPEQRSEIVRKAWATRRAKANK